MFLFRCAAHNDRMHLYRDVAFCSWYQWIMILVTDFQSCSIWTSRSAGRNSRQGGGGRTLFCGQDGPSWTVSNEAARITTTFTLILMWIPLLYPSCGEHCSQIHIFLDPGTAHSPSYRCRRRMYTRSIGTMGHARCAWCWGTFMAITRTSRRRRPYCTACCEVAWMLTRSRVWSTGIPDGMPR